MTRPNTTGAVEASRRIDEALLAGAPVLDLSGLELGTLPPELAQLIQLSELDLQANALAELPDGISELRNLIVLNVGGNSLTELPEWISELPELSQLDISDNQLSALPEWIADIASLTALNISKNLLTTLPHNIGGLRNLTRLEISFNQLRTLPDSIGRLRKLYRLLASSNQLVSLPESLANLTELGHLEVSDNQLTSLRADILNLTKLRGLCIDNNQLTTLPNDISKPAELCYLTVNNNQLTTLPDWFVDPPALDILRIGGNPFVSPPPEIVAAGPNSALKFLQARREGASAQWVSKLLIVGEGGVGKTSLVRRLGGQPYDPDEPSTHGLRVERLDVPHPTRSDVEMQLSAWDFGGQQIYHATHQFFLTNRSLFLLLWNSRLGWEQGKLRYWLDIIAARAPQSPIILVATHVGGRPVDLPLDDLMREYPMIVDSMSVDSETGEGLGALNAQLADQAAKLPLMGSEWPTKWLAAADSLRYSPHKHITPEQMWQLMTAAGVVDPVQQRYVAIALHELGDILYYNEDPELCQTVVLRPEWVNEYISKVLDSHEVAAADGLLSREHLQELWQDLDRGLRDHFLGMMDKYDLSYRVDGSANGDVSLVVERLPWNSPPFQQEWDAAAGSQQIKVFYRFNTMPPGIPTWFIARSHRFSTNTHWRTGAVLKHGNHLALVRADQHRNTVELTVRGPVPAAFFSILDDGLNRTLERFPGLDIDRQVACTCQEACTELYNYEDLSSRLSRVPPRHEIECRKSGEYVDVPGLLLGLAPSERDGTRMSLDLIAKTLTRMDDKLSEQAEYNQRMFLRLQHFAQSQQETRCPNVLALVPVKGRRLATSPYELRLYCEEPGSWHRMPEPDGCYVIRQPNEWFRKVGPYLQGLLKVMKHAAPLAGPVLGISVDKLDQQLKSDCDLMKELVSQSPTQLRHDDELGEIDSTPSARAGNDADFRALEAMLTELDPDRIWGGLSRTTTPEGLTLYLCKDHRASYLPRS